MSIAQRLQQWFGGGTAIPRSLQRELQLVRRLQADLATNSSRTPVEEFRSLRYQLRVRPQDAALHCAGLATACWASDLALGLRPHDVQVLAALALRRGVMIEMATGEGKTLVAALAATVSSLAGEGVHVATANDYLATRDAHWGTPLFQSLGLRVAAIAQAVPRSRRRDAYLADITYSTARELAFDFLRDRLALRTRREMQLLFASQPGPQSASRAGSGAEAADQPVQRGLRRALLDEADSLLLDEARVPLIIAGPVADAALRVALARWASDLARALR
ncbi:MAG: preprotein translocase subunit SecA, partial [Planctomycetaceae bacterium]